MRLLGSYGDNEGYVYSGLFETTVFYFDWLFDYLGHGGQATADGVVAGGVVTGGLHQEPPELQLPENYRLPGNEHGLRGSLQVDHGAVTVTALGGPFPTILRRKGYDNRTAMGSGAVQLVSPMLTHWVVAGCCQTSTAAIGILKVRFVPEPASLMMLGAGISLLGLLSQVRRRPGDR